MADVEIVNGINKRQGTGNRHAPEDSHARDWDTVIRRRSAEGNNLKHQHNTDNGQHTADQFFLSNLLLKQNPHQKHQNDGI